MQFLFSVVETFLPGGVRGDHAGSATPPEAAAIHEYNERLVREGHWIFAGGLSAPREATVLDNRGGRGESSSGPLSDSAENVGGFWVIEAQDADAALALAAEASEACNRRVEVRPLL
ncbi:hypothetical protein AS850_02235 [Frondihabitans sp. 762G35]|uniref:YciI family protein n=1 Tax=Frondihabitans sp. 762G35 TaxID=1446794 RepID=UPI000D20B3BA|nr:YciI family protein [Frondihabitans sp. 762G35]ARC55896.1 hypothetical protein AS850_02235 [Frondihabitans sp. 762G35]